MRISTYTNALTQEQKVSAAFSAQSAMFDNIDAKNIIIQWMRKKIREHVLELWKPGDTILELNAGTGTDTIFFAQKGFKLYATDNSPGMLNVLNKKIAELSLRDTVSTQLCSFSGLNQIERGGFDHIFSNFGGLNCTDKLDRVINSFYRLLKPGGTATLVLMPKICIWELMLTLKGNFKVGFRRLKKDGTPSHLEGEHFMTYYYSPPAVRKMFGNAYSKISIKGLGISVPPPYLNNFPIKYPYIYKVLLSIENSIEDVPLLRSSGDHFILSVRKNG